MYRLLTFLALILLSAAWIARSSPSRLVITGNTDFEVRDEKAYHFNKPFTGVAVQLFPDGKVYSETRYVKGVKEGSATEYATTGALRARWNYQSGKKEGLQQGWFIEGPKRFEQHYRAGMLEGTQTEWHQNGTVFNQQTYHDGFEVARKVLFPNSEIYSNYVKQDGRKYGLDGGALCFEVKKDGER